VIKVGLVYVDSYSFAFLRLLIASIVILAVVIPLRKLPLGLFKNRLIWVLAMSNAVGFILQYVGMNYTTASKTVLLVDSDVVIVALLSWLTFKEYFSNQMKLAVVMGFLGAALLATGGNLSELTGGELLGDVLVFLAGVSWAFFMVWNKSMISKGIDPTAMTAGVISSTAIVLLPFALVLGNMNVAAISVEGWGATIYMAVFCSVIAYFTWTVTLKGLTVTHSAILLLLEIIWALILSFWFLGESFTPVAMVGAALILVSILLASK